MLILSQILGVNVFTDRQGAQGMERFGRNKVWQRKTDIHYGFHFTVAPSTFSLVVLHRNNLQPRLAHTLKSEVNILVD